MRQAIKKTLARGGIRVERLSQEERLVRDGYDPRHMPPVGDLDTLVPSNTRLLELERAYLTLAPDDTSDTYASSIWAPALSSTPEDLRFFRGDNLYLWQYTRSPRHNAYRAFIYAKYVLEIDTRGLLGAALTEDGAFGCFTFDFAGMPTLSRDLLDSVNEISFLSRHVDVLDKPGAHVVDIGAGYGRLAHRMLTAGESMAHYWCLDAVARSTFLCEYYLAHRGLSDRSTVVPLHEVVDGGGPLPDRIDLAVNIHCFSEMPHAAVRFWLSLLADRDVPYLLIVPNERDQVLSREPDGSRRDCASLLRDAGYKLIASEPTIRDEAVRDVLELDDYFLLYSRD